MIYHILKYVSKVLLATAGFILAPGTRSLPDIDINPLQIQETGRFFHYAEIQHGNVGTIVYYGRNYFCPTQ